jgi:hypothetical protein
VSIRFTVRLFASLTAAVGVFGDGVGLVLRMQESTMTTDEAGVLTPIVRVVVDAIRPAGMEFFFRHPFRYQVGMVEGHAAHQCVPESRSVK